VAVEKLARSEFAKIRSRQEALQTIFQSVLGIVYHPIFDFFRETDFFNNLILDSFQKNLSVDCKLPVSMWFGLHPSINFSERRL